MSRHDVEAGDLLWKYIEELHRTDEADAVNFIARTSLDPVEMAELLPIADALHTDLCAASALADGATTGGTARAQLLMAIQADSAPAPPAARSSWKFRLPQRSFALPSRSVFALACLLLGIAAAAWMFYAQNGAAYSDRPKYIINRSGEGCEIKPE